MQEKINAALQTMWSVIPSETEFWSAILGAIVGGLIAYLVQIKALRETRRQREDDHKRVTLALGNALLFKMIRIHSDCFHVHEYIESCYSDAAQRGFTGEPWQFVLPAANLPAPVNFTSDEMGMLLAQKDDNVFNLIVSMDVVHNSLIDAFGVLNAERRALGERLRPNEATGAVVSGYLDKDQLLALRPRMIEVNSLCEQLRIRSKQNSDESGDALRRVHGLLRERLGLQYKLESTAWKKLAASA